MIHDIFLIYSQVYFQLKTGKKKKNTGIQHGLEKQYFYVQKRV